MSERKGYGWVQVYSDFPISASTTSTTSSNILVEDYNNHTVQAFFSTGSLTGSLIVQSSLEGTYWTTETTLQVSTSSQVSLTSGRRVYLRHLFKFVGASTGSVYQLSGQ